VLGGDPLAGVDDREGDGARPQRGLDPDAAAAGGVAERIGDEVLQHLAEADRVGLNLGGRWLGYFPAELDAGVDGARGVGGDDVGDRSAGSIPSRWRRRAPASASERVRRSSRRRLITVVSSSSVSKRTSSRG
jgi:hypothetical protein